MLRAMTGREFQEWIAFSELEPFEPERLEQVITMINKTLINLHRKRGTRPLKLRDCLPMFGDAATAPSAKPKADWRKMLAIAQAMTLDSKRG